MGQTATKPDKVNTWRHVAKPRVIVFAIYVHTRKKIFFSNTRRGLNTSKKYWSVSSSNRNLLITNLFDSNGEQNILLRNKPFPILNSTRCHIQRQLYNRWWSPRLLLTGKSNSQTLPNMQHYHQRFGTSYCFEILQRGYYRQFERNQRQLAGESISSYKALACKG